MKEREVVKRVVLPAIFLVSCGITTAIAYIQYQFLPSEGDINEAKPAPTAEAADPLFGVTVTPTVLAQILQDAASPTSISPAESQNLSIPPSQDQRTVEVPPRVITHRIGDGERLFSLVPDLIAKGGLLAACQTAQQQGRSCSFVVSLTRPAQNSSSSVELSDLSPKIRMTLQSTYSVGDLLTISLKTNDTAMFHSPSNQGAPESTQAEQAQATHSTYAQPPETTPSQLEPGGKSVKVWVKMNNPPGSAVIQEKLISKRMLTDGTIEYFLPGFLDDKIFDVATYQIQELP